ncbi:hypothetical protein N9L68_07370 [bacterium]|nr:hypothetical protein [bacterium]
MLRLGAGWPGRLTCRTWADGAIRDWGLLTGVYGHARSLSCPMERGDKRRRWCPAARKGMDTELGLIRILRGWKSESDKEARRRARIRESRRQRRTGGAGIRSELERDPAWAVPVEQPVQTARLGDAARAPGSTALDPRTLGSLFDLCLTHPPGAAGAPAGMDGWPRMLLQFGMTGTTVALRPERGVYLQNVYDEQQAMIYRYLAGWSRVAALYTRVRRAVQMQRSRCREMGVGYSGGNPLFDKRERVR